MSVPSGAAFKRVNMLMSTKVTSFEQKSAVVVWMGTIHFDVNWLGKDLADIYMGRR